MVKTKKVLSILLTLCMVLSVVPMASFSAFAGDNVAKIGDQKYATLEAAITAATEGQTIVLLDNVDLTSHTISVFDVVAFADGVTLDLAGYTISSNNGGVTYVGENVTIKNGKFVAVNSGSYAICFGDWFYQYENGIDPSFILEDLTLEGGIRVEYTALTIRNVDVTACNYYAIYDVCSDVTIESGKFTHYGTNTIIWANYEGSPITILGGYFSKAPEAAYINDADFIGKGLALEDNTDEATMADYPYVVPQAVAQIGDTYYTSLTNAIAAVPADEAEATTITMIADETLEVNTGVTIPANKNIILDLNNCVVTGSATTGSCSLITNNGTLIVTDNSADKGGKLTTSVNPGQHNAGYYVISNYGTLTIAGGTIEEATTDPGYQNGRLCYAIDVDTGSGNTPVLNITGGKVVCGYQALRVYCGDQTGSSTATVNISGGEVESYYGPLGVQIPSYSAAAPKVIYNVTGGTITSTHNSKLAYIDSHYANLDVSNILYNFENGKFCSSNAEFINLDTSESGSYAAGTANKDIISISGGFYKVQPNADYLATGKTVVDNTDNATKADYPYTIGAANVAKIDSTEYPTLEEAAAAATAGQTITLIADVDLTKYVKVNDIVPGTHINFASGVTLDLAGYTITSNNFGVVYQGEDVTIKNGKFVAANNGSYSLFIGDGDPTSMSLEGLTLVGGVNVYGATATITDTVSSAAQNYYAVWADEAGNITINGGKFTHYGSMPVVKATTNNGKITINGGYFDIAPDAKYIAEGYKVVPNLEEDTKDAYPYKVAKPVAEIDGTYYASLEEAAVAAQAGETITLVADVDLTKYVKVNDSITGKDINFADGVTLDLDGHKISSNNFGVVYQGKNVTIKNGTFEAVNNGSYSIFVGDGDTTSMTLEGLVLTGGVNVYEATVTLKDNVSSSAQTHYSVWAEDGSNVTIEDGLYKHYGNMPVVLESSSTITITGGCFSKAPDAKYIADGYAVTANTDESTKTDYPYTVGTVVCKIGDNGYATIQDAFKAADDGDKIDIIGEVSYNANEVPDNVSVDVDKNATQSIAEGTVTDTSENAFISNIEADVSGVKEYADSLKAADKKAATFKLNVKDTTLEETDDAYTALTNQATADGRTNTTFLDVTVTKNGVAIDDTGSALQSYTVTCNMTGKCDLSVYRYHGKEVEEFKQIYDVADAADKTFMVSGSGANTKVTIYSSKFSNEVIATKNIPEVFANATFTASLVLNDKIDVIFDISGLNSALFQPNDLSITVNGEEWTDYTTSKSLYGKIITIAPTEMSKEVVIKITYDGTTITKTFSVLKYCNAVYNHADYGPDSYVGKLCTAILNYGKYAEDYKNGNTESTLNSGHVLSNVNIITEKDTASSKTNVGTSLTLGDTISMNYYVKSDSEITKDNVVITNNYDEAVLKERIEVTASDNADYDYKITIKDVYAEQMSRQYTLTIDGVDIITYSVYNYCKDAQSESNETVKSLCQAIYSYGEAAAEVMYN